MGLPWDKEEIQEATNAKKLFFLKHENPLEYKNGIKMEIIPQPWLEVAYHIIQYICYEGRMSGIYAYHFRCLHHLRNLSHQQPEESLNIPYFFLQSLK